jgi:acetyl esterase/lipase
MKSFAALFLLFSFFCFATLSCSSTDEETMEMEDAMDDTDDSSSDDGDSTGSLEASVMLDVSYGSNAQQVYDIYLPANRTASKTKVILLVHGGGWTGGDKADMTGFVDFVQATFPEHAVVNTNYVLATLTGITAFPNQYEDLQAVINQLRTQKDDLQILPEFGMIGTSAGAHLSMMYDYVYDITDEVKFVANIVGPSDFTDPFYADDPNFDLALALFVDESAYPAGTDYAAINSPVQVVTESASPTAMFYGDMDPLVPLSNGNRLDTALFAKGIEHVFSIYNGGHGDDWSNADQTDLVIKIGSYIDTYLAIPIQ